MKPEKTGQPATPEHSPKLKMAMLEITAIMEKHDVAGVIELFIPGFNEIKAVINPSFSLVNINAKNSLNISTPIVDLSDPGKAQQKKVDTINMLANMRLHLGRVVMVLAQAEMAVRKEFDMMPPSGQSLPLKPTN